jgi:DNA-binding beta-propeller fold protein YncE
MSLQHTGFIELPAHKGKGGFDHAAVHQATAHLYVAHTANDAIDVIDTRVDKFLDAIPNLTGVAGALVSDERNLVFTSNRGENTVGIFNPNKDSEVVKVGVGVRPNGLSYDPRRNLLLAANVGDPSIANSYTVSMVNVETKTLVANVLVPGRTRWTIFDAMNSLFFVNIADPSVIVVIDSTQPTQVARAFNIPAIGPHGLDLDAGTNRLFCACDGKRLVCLNAQSGQILAEADLSGVPDVIFFNRTLKHLYVAIGDPGVIDVFDTDLVQRIETISTESGAHTIAFQEQSNKVYAFLPHSHRAAVYVDR